MNVCLCVVLIKHSGRGELCFLGMEVPIRLLSPMDSRNLKSWHFRLHFLGERGPDFWGICGNRRYYAWRRSCAAGYGNGFKGWSLDTELRPGNWAFGLRPYCGYEEKHINSFPFSNIIVTAMSLNRMEIDGYIILLANKWGHIPAMQKTTLIILISSSEFPIQQTE